MTNDVMERAQFEALIAAYGAEPARWPAEHRADMQAYIAANPADVREALVVERALDEALSASPRPAPSADLAARVLAQRPAALTDIAPAPAWMFWRASGPYRMAGAALACALVLCAGAATGFVEASSGREHADASALLLAAGWYDEDDELFSLGVDG